MDLVLKNLRIEDCEICCDVGEYSNQGKNGTLTFEFKVDNNPVKRQKAVKLYYPPQKASIPPTPHTGLVHSVVATLVMDTQTKSERQDLQFCR